MLVLNPSARSAGVLKYFALSELHLSIGVFKLLRHLQLEPKKSERLHKLSIPDGCVSELAVGLREQLLV